MARYDEAQADYGEFADIMGEMQREISGEEVKLKEDLESRAAAGEGSEQKRRDELTRAVDVSCNVHAPCTSKNKIMSHRLGASSFGKNTARHSPSRYRMCKHALGQIFARNP